MFSTGKKTHPGTLPQFQALENQAADIPHGSARNGLGQCGSRPKESTAGIEPLRGEPAGNVNPAASPAMMERSTHAARGVSLVFVLASSGTPLMPCHPARARRFLKNGRARIHKLYPFTIRLVDRPSGELQPVTIKIDPGATVTGFAITRLHTQDPTLQTTLHLAELTHRGTSIRQRNKQRSGYRRRRRSAHLRCRPPRFNNRRRAAGWLPPSLTSRVDNILSWVGRYAKLAPLSAIALESVRFDTQILQNSEISGVEYQQGTLAGYQLREYLLEKWGRQCVYCDKTNIPLEIEHIVPKASRGSNRSSNLTLACHDCNQRKGNTSVEQFLSDQPDRLQRILSHTKKHLAASAAVNATRNSVVQKLHETELPIATFCGGLTKFNRAKLSIPKTHALDAGCVGTLDHLANWNIPVFCIKATGRGTYQRTRVTKDGFPRGYLPRHKTVHGFHTGDLVKTVIPKGKKTGIYTGRVAVRTSGSFNLQTSTATIQGISHRHCRRICRADGYTYHLQPPNYPTLNSSQA
jgi:5-methylcytosine-specific restriction endonuclease McrA